MLSWRGIPQLPLQISRTYKRNRRSVIFAHSQIHSDDTCPQAAEKVLRTSLKKLWKRFELDRGSLNGVIEHSNALGVEITEDRDYIDRSCRKVIESNDVLLSADTSSRRATAERKFEEIQDFVWTMCLRVLETARARQLTIDACSQLLEIHTDDKLDEIDERLSAQGREIMLCVVSFRSNRSRGS